MNEELCSAFLQHGKLFNYCFIKVSDVLHKFLFCWEHDQSAEAILWQGVSHEGLGPLQSGEAPLRFSCCHENLEKDECALKVVLHEKPELRHCSTASFKSTVLIEESSVLSLALFSTGLDSTAVSSAVSGNLTLWCGNSPPCSRVALTRCWVMAKRSSVCSRTLSHTWKKDCFLL